MPVWLEAWFWGSVAGSALLLGAAAGYYLRVPARVIAGVMAFGAGVLISALAFDLMGDAYEHGGFDATACGFLGGALVFTLANVVLARQGAKHRKRSGHHHVKEAAAGNNAGAIAVGAALDAVPESIAIGVSLLAGGAVGVVTVTAIFLSNIPEALSSSAGMRRAGRPAAYVFGLWAGIAVLSGLAALAGYAVFNRFPADVLAATIAFAAGAILAMLVDTMIPEAFEEAHELAGLITVLGFLLAFVLSHWR